MALTDKQVLFKRGLQASLDAIKKNAQGTPGTFYFAEDSHRLYMGVAGGQVVPVNDGVIKVANVDSLPTTGVHGTVEYGTFYYAIAENILCVYNGTGWTQINPDHNYYINKAELTGKFENEVVETTQTFTRNDGGSVSTVLKFGGDGDHVTVSWDDTNKIVSFACDISYSLESVKNATNGNAAISLKEAKDGTKGSYKITGEGGVSVTSDANGNIKIAGAGTAAQLAGGSAAFDANGNVDFNISQENGHAIDFELAAPTVKLNDESTHAFKNGVAELPVYTTTEIDNLLKGLDALVYKGTTASIPSGTQEIGFVYKATQEISGVKIKGGSTATAKAGDLLIANATKETSGVISAADLYWDIVSSGDDYDTTYVGVSLSNGVKLQDSHGANVHQVEAEGDGTYIDVAATATNSNKGTKFTVSHKTHNVTVNQETEDSTPQTAEGTKTIDVIDSITYDAAGHITAIQKRKETFTDTNGSLTVNSDSIEAVDKGVKISNTVTFKHSQGAENTITASHTVKSANDNMTVTAESGAVVINLFWGSF